MVPADSHLLAEIVGVPVAHRRRHLAGALIGGAQQLLGQLHPIAGDVLGEGGAHLLAEHRREVVGGDIRPLAKIRCSVKIGA